MDETPGVVLAVYAHPDDADVGCGGTLARWAKAGSAVHLVVCTDGGKGTSTPRSCPTSWPPSAPASSRRRPRSSGSPASSNLGFPDGELTDSDGFRRTLVGTGARACVPTWCAGTTRRRSSSGRTTSTTATTASPAARCSTPWPRRRRCRTTSPTPARPTRCPPSPLGHARARRVGRRHRHHRDEGGGRGVPPQPVRRPERLGRRGGAAPGGRGGPAGRRRLRRGVPPADPRWLSRPPVVPTILHVDMDAFFASVEVLDDPSLAGKPVIVGGAGARGVVASCTYEARAFGVHSAMPSVRARQLCPEAVFLSGRHGRYAEVSGELHKILADVTPMVEPIGLDEAFMDVAGALRLLGSARPDRARPAPPRARRARTGLRGRDRPLQDDRQARLAGGQAAGQPDGTRTRGRASTWSSPPTSWRSCTRHDVEALWGVGPATAKRLHDLGVRTVGDLAALPLDTWCGGSARRAAPIWRRWPGARTPTRSTRTGPTSRSGTRRPSARTWSTRTSSSATCCAWPSRWPPCCGARRPRPGRSR